jgi:hypothetical protein
LLRKRFRGKNSEAMQAIRSLTATRSTREGRHTGTGTGTVHVHVHVHVHVTGRIGGKGGVFVVPSLRERFSALFSTTGPVLNSTGGPIVFFHFLTWNPKAVTTQFTEGHGDRFFGFKTNTQAFIYAR